MVIKPVGQSEIPSQIDDPTDNSDILRIVDAAIPYFESIAHNRTTLATVVDGIIDLVSAVVKERKDLSLGREALCRLLKTSIEDVRIKIIDVLLQMFDINLVVFDIKMKQSNSLVELEKKMSNFIDSCVRSSGSSPRLMLCFLDLYQNILEHLWLLPHLSEDREAYAVITEQNGMRIKNEAQNWISLISKNSSEKELNDLIENIKSMLEKIAVPPRNLVSNLERVKQNLPSKPLDCISFVSEIGKLYLETKDFHRAIFYLLKLLNMFDLSIEDIKRAARENPAVAADPKTLAVFRSTDAAKVGCYVRLSEAYNGTQEMNKEMDCLFKALKIAGENKLEEEGKICLILGQRTSDLFGDFRKAIEYYTKALDLAHFTKDQQLEAEANVSLGDAYRMLGNYSEADRYYETSLDIPNRIKASSNIEIRVFRGRGNIHLAVADYVKALEWFTKALNLAQSHHDDYYVGATYICLGDVYSSSGGKQKALESYEKALQISQKIKNRSMEAHACGGLANVHSSLKQFSDAAQFSDRAQQLEQELRTFSSQGVAAASQGERFMHLGKYPEAVECFERALAIAKTIKDPEEQGNIHLGLGRAYAAQQDFQQATNHFLQSAGEYSEIHKTLGNNQWKITLFEAQADAYIALEGTLFIQKHFVKALEITDLRRSRAMVSMLSKRLASQNIKVDEQPLTYKDMQKLAAKFKTTFIIYSLYLKDHLLAWVIPPLVDLGSITIGRISPEVLNFKALSEDMKVPNRVQNSYPFRRVKQTAPSETMHFLEETKEFSSTKPEAQIHPGTLKRFHNRLTKWYESLIAPLEKYIPKDEGLSLTIIPDGFLSQIPFAAFRDGEKGPYLIEKYPISIAPSIKILQLLDALPKEAATSLPCIMGNPDTRIKSDDLPWSTEEINQVGQLFNVSQETILTREKATAKNILQSMQNARYTHFSCHGEPDEKLEPDSVFEGLLKLAPDDLHPKGYFYAQEVASLTLRSELVFLSACFSGTGKIQREGSIGNVWSFLAAGAQSVIAAHWRVPQSDLTRDMVVTFYKHLLNNKATKAEALRQAMIMAINKERENPHLWGAYFFSGLK